MRRVQLLTLAAIAASVLASDQTCRSQTRPADSQPINEQTASIAATEPQPLTIGKLSPAPAGVDAPALAREVREQESHFDDLKSLHLKLDDAWSNSPQGTLAHIAELKKQFPSMVIDEAHFPDLKPTNSGKLEIAFDDHRLLYRAESPDGWYTTDLKIWDGHRAMFHEKYKGGQESFAYQNDPKRIGQYLMMDLAWPRTASQHLWWKEDGQVIPQEIPECFVVGGVVDCGGHECYQLDGIGTRYFVGLNDHRLYGLEYDYQHMSEAQSNEIEGQVAKDFGQTPGPAFEKWEWALTPLEHARVFKDRTARQQPYMLKLACHFLGDYHEISAGLFMPMRMEYHIYTKDDDSYIHSTRRMQVTSVEVNQPLPDSLFQMEMVDGIQVNDWSNDPPLFYKSKKDRTPAEWEAIVAEARQRKMEELARQAKADSIIGQDAPAFPDLPADWLNSKPIAWADLKGKPVVLDFWAEWCGPCMNFMNLSQDIASHAADDGIAIIGIHPPGSDLSKIKKIISTYNLTYPICIDHAAAKEQQGWGGLYSIYEVSAIPESILLGLDGKIMARGDLPAMVSQARQIAGGAKASTQPVEVK